MKYPYLSTLIGAYLNQDYAHYADTVEGVIDVYKNEATPDDVRQLRADIAAFLLAEKGALDDVFEAEYGFHFSPQLWGMTTESFLHMLDERLKQ